jgi:hypothetical protein
LPRSARAPKPAWSNLERYLKYDAVASDSAIENAKSDYRTVNRNRQIKEALPVAWQQLLRDQDELLVDLVSERVATICGYKPESETVAGFLQQLATGLPAPPPATTPRAHPQPAQPPTDVHLPSLESGEILFSGFSFNGQRYHEGSAINTLMRVLEVLSSRDTTFLERYASLPRHGRKRRYVSRDKMELYPGRPDLCEEYSVSRFGGWWIGTNYNRSTIMNAIELACQVAGLRFGTDLKLI